MEHLLEILFAVLFGVKTGTGPAGVDRSVGFNPPHWMSWGMLTPRIVNAALILAAIALVALIYRRDGRRRGPRIGLGILRVLAIAYVLALINRPVINITRSRTEPSVLAVLIDHTLSMSMRDVNADGSPAAHAAPLHPDAPGAGSGDSSPTRLSAVVRMLSAGDQALLAKLAKVHTIRLYEFDKDARAIGTIPGPGAAPAASAAQTRPAGPGASEAAQHAAVAALDALKPTAPSTQVLPSLLTVLDDLQGQRVAGIVLISDGEETPTAAPQSVLELIRRFPVKVYPVPVGSEKAPTNVELASLSVQDSAFTGDIVAARVQVRASGYPAGKTVRVSLWNKQTNQPLIDPEGDKPAEQTVTIDPGVPADAEIDFKAGEKGSLQVEARAEVQPGEINVDDNVKTSDLAVLDAKINLLYVEGYPRWEYRYIKNLMMRPEVNGRRKTVNISCLLESADPNFAQEGDPPEPFYKEGDPRNGSEFPGPITRFPETMDELMKYDVVLFGDVDPRLFDDRQKQMIYDFVDKKGGGFGMIAGPRYAPLEYRNTPIESVLPVDISHVLPDDPAADYREGFRPIVTDEGRRGEGSTIFRFFPDKKKSERYIREDLQPLFWYCRGISVKPNVGLVYAEHPYDSDPNTGRKAPLLVLGQFGAGRTMFSAYDDTWRWRYYTGESIFDNYWMQQLRYLARSRKLGQRRFSFVSSRNSYALGTPVTLDLKVIDPKLQSQLPPELRVDMVDAHTGQIIGQPTLQRQEASPETYTVTFTADRMGEFHVRPPSDVAQDKVIAPLSFSVVEPELELSKPQVNLDLFHSLAPADQIVPLAQARATLPRIIKSAEVKREVTSSEPLWDTWRALLVFVGLITTEWVLRKVAGMI